MSDTRNHSEVRTGSSPRTTTVQREGGIGTGMMVGLLVAALFIAALAYAFWPTSQPGPDGAETNVTVETPAPAPDAAAPPANEPMASQPAGPTAPPAEPLVTEPEPAAPPTDSAPAEPAAPEPPPAPAPAQ